MNPTLRALALFLTLSVTLAADPAARLQAAREARQFRASLVEELRSGREQPERALARLRARTPAKDADADTELAFGAMEIGMRLREAQEHEAAAPFLRAAEDSLGAAIRRTPDSDAVRKSMLLRERAFVRGNLLDQYAEADADLVAALALQPGDKMLLRKRELLRGRTPGYNPHQPAKQ